MPGLSPAQRASASDATPGFIDAPAPYRELVERAGFSDVSESDVTPDYRRTAAAWLREMSELEPELRKDLGDQVFEEKQANRQRSMAAIEAGDLGRTQFIANAP